MAYSWQKSLVSSNADLLTVLGFAVLPVLSVRNQVIQIILEIRPKDTISSHKSSPAPVGWCCLSSISVQTRRNTDQLLSDAYLNE